MSHDPYAVAVVLILASSLSSKDWTSIIVGHVPRTISYLCYFFLGRKGTITCHVSGERQYSWDLPQGGLEVPCTLNFFGPCKEIEKIKRLIVLACTDHVKVDSTEPPSIKKQKIVIDDAPLASNVTELQWLNFQGCILTVADKVISVVLV